jgi:hypothetical protein
MYVTVNNNKKCGLPVDLMIRLSEKGPGCDYISVP